MKLWLRLTLAVAGLAILWNAFAFLDTAAAQAPAPASGKKAGEFFQHEILWL